ncbi:MarR family winged helix-turn-helix transcriptional regulator [Parasediminibacterium sp. JCM 36343]|uniref:MarR family winged helix-turn-helix transcriptional regulator n=1 Tax=Parasediminibacterium sp. JCM 36343 TaxID=3374279 RepID=UPI00397D9A06
MNIEKEIQQIAFRNEYQKATVNLIFTASWLQEKIRLLLEPADITIQQYNILRILKGSKTALSTLQIRERMIDKMSDTSRLVIRLIKKGLVEKAKSKLDKRLVDVVISAKGLEVLASLDEQQMNLDNVVAGISTQEAIILNILLDKMRG